MESFFFNITDNRSYKITSYEGYTRVDISNGIVFLDIKTKAKVVMKNLDRLIILTITKNGTLTIGNLTSNSGKSCIYATSRQDFSIDASGEVFILFIADFFLKKYFSGDENEPIDFLYKKIQNELLLELTDSQPIDALTIHIID